MIKGLVPALAEGGKIKIGGLGAERKSKGGGTYRLPVKYDYFVVTKTTRGANGDLEEDTAIMDALRGLSRHPDGRVREIPIVLHSDEIDEVFPTAYALYSGRKLFCRGDGETATRHEMVDGKRTGRTKEMACTCELLGAEGKMCCKPHGILHCSIPIPGCAVAGSVYKWRTTSKISCQRMIGSLMQITDMVGGLRGIPLMLCVRPVDVAPVNSPASTVYCCHIEIRESDVLAVQRRVIEARKMRAQVTGAYNYKLLIEAPATDDETSLEQEEIQQEFHPEVEDDATARHQPAIAAVSLGAMLAGNSEDHQDHDESARVTAQATKARKAAPVEAPSPPSRVPEPEPTSSRATKPSTKTAAKEAIKEIQAEAIEEYDEPSEPPNTGPLPSLSEEDLDDIPFDEAAAVPANDAAETMKAATVKEIGEFLTAMGYDVEIVPAFAEKIGLPARDVISDYGQIELNRILDGLVKEQRAMAQRDAAAEHRAGLIAKIQELRAAARAAVTPDPFPDDGRFKSYLGARMLEPFDGDLVTASEPALQAAIAVLTKLVARAKATVK